MHYKMCKKNEAGRRECTPKSLFFPLFFYCGSRAEKCIYMQKETEKWKKIAQMRLNLSHAAF